MVTLKDFHPNILIDPTCGWEGLLWSLYREWINITPNSYMIRMESDRYFPGFPLISLLSMQN